MNLRLGAVKGVSGEAV